MITFVLMVQAACVVALACLVFLLFRNRWVCKTRCMWIWDNYTTYMGVVSYDAMLYRVWKWSTKAEDWQKR